MTGLPRPPRAAESAIHRTARAEAIKKAWQANRRPDAAAALRENPDIAADRAIALDLAYEEFCTREEAGEALDPAAFCAHFSFGASLHRLLTVHQFLDEHPDALGGAVPTVWPTAGQAVGDFLVLRELGRGSFARAYLAVETTAGNRPVALKVSAAGSREADTLGPLSHPHLVPVLSSRAIGSWTVVAMPFAGTATLEDVVATVWPSDRTAPPRSAAELLDAATRGGHPDDPPYPSRPAFPVHAGTSYADAVAAVAVGVFDAVAYLHDRGIVHRDLKPSNVLFGPGGHPYLLDFNLATRVADPWRLVGTLPYMAPEQLSHLAETGAQPPPDGRPGDVFACGVILFQLLTGKHPFGASNTLLANQPRDRAAAALLGAQRKGHLALAPLNRCVRRGTRDAIERCLALDPTARPTAAELVELFTRAGRRRSYRLPVSGLVTVSILGLALSISTPWRTAPATEAPAPTDVAVAPPELTPFEEALQLYRSENYGLAAAKFMEIGTAGKDGRAYGYAAYCFCVINYDPSASLVASDEAIRLGYKEAPVYANRAYLRLKDKRLLNDALDDCNEALSRDSNLLAARYTRACVHLRRHLEKHTAAVPAEALEDIERVTAVVTDNAEVWWTAATLYVLAPGSGAAERNKAAWALKRAILAGKSPQFVARNPVLKKALIGHPEYNEIMALYAGPSAPQANPHLVNPIP
ncbi:serine/threonine-protein kinase [Frigoriglobus tundricola]|uniref:non-specific serine/threonine protein kinase n=1 Tax=Frigoriglobus tundricola TaxID=2774151 RepID=A0A6M5Z0Z6_9BACT|nr:serine/threonine-protein kinase [Frigoriglobus tundricola]QJW99416.1 hypothetical protein FTUN_7028 [Frigoriglobus tundricola]